MNGLEIKTLNPEPFSFLTKISFLLEAVTKKPEILFRRTPNDPADRRQRTVFSDPSEDTGQSTLSTKSKIPPPSILLTNDDGIFAKGLESLVMALKKKHPLWVVAPESEQSAVEHALTLTQPLRVKKILEWGLFRLWGQWDPGRLRQNRPS